MSNDANRTIIVLFAALSIVVLAVVIFLSWAAPGDVIEALGDVVQEMDENNDSAGKLIVTLGALALAVLALLLIVLELAPEDEEKELRVEQAGSTTIVPAQQLRIRIEESLNALSEVTGATAKVWTREKGIASSLDVSVLAGTNFGTITQDCSRVVVDTIQTELGLPVAGLPTVRVTIGGVKTQPVASSVARPPEAVYAQATSSLDAGEVMGTAADAATTGPVVMDPLEGTAVDPAPRDGDAAPETQPESDPPPS